MRFWMEYEMDKSHYYFFVGLYPIIWICHFYTYKTNKKNLSLALNYKKESKYRGKNNEGMETLWIKK